MIFKAKQWIKERTEADDGILEVTFNNEHNHIMVGIYPPLNEFDVIKIGDIWDSDQQEFYDPYETFRYITLFSKGELQIKSVGTEFFEYVDCNCSSHELSVCSQVCGKIISIDVSEDLSRDIDIELECFGAIFQAFVNRKHIDKIPSVGDTICGLFEVIGI